MANKITNSAIDPSAKLFRDVRVVNSTIAAHCVVGDDSDLVDVELEPYAELGRRNLVRNSILGSGSYTGTNTIIRNTTIGKYCSISWDVSIGGANHDYTAASTYRPYWWKRVFGVDVENSVPASRCTFGNDVWVGAGAIVTTGTQLGHGCVVGAGAVVTKDVPPYAIVVGCPAKVIKYRFEETVRERLLNLAWWDWPHRVIAEAAPLLSSGGGSFPGALSALEDIAKDMDVGHIPSGQKQCTGAEE